MLLEAPKVCPICGIDVTNGVGPEKLPEVTKLLNNLPSSHLFRKAADWHDYGYHIGYREVDRQTADEFFYRAMLEAIHQECSWYSRCWYRLQAYRNFLFVRKFGRHFFNYKGCSSGLAWLDSNQSA